MSYTDKQLKNHPMYAILAMTLGEKEGLKTLRAKLEETAKDNQAVTEFTDTKKIIIPQSMNKQQASNELQRQWDDEENIIKVDRSFSQWHWKEVLVATRRTLEEVFGWVDGKTTYGFFGANRPKDIEVVTDVKNGVATTETCFHGTVNISPWEDAELEVGAGHLSCEVKKRYRAEVKAFYDAIEKQLQENSIFRAKSIVVTLGHDFRGNEELEFEIIETNPSPKIVLNSDLENIINLFVIDELGNEGKRSYLFSGGYGNGKTETAMRIGNLANQEGMAFFYCKDAAAFQELLRYSVNYQPALVFLEDVDEITSGEKRDSRMNSILNTLDGVQTKGKDITVIFTTNHEDRINKALRRPGRIDIVAHFANPDEAARVKIYQSYLETLDTSNKLNYKALAKKTGEIPGAVIAEICKRAVKLINKGTCTNKTVEGAIDSMKHHLKLMAADPEAKKAQDVKVTISNTNVEEISA